MQLLWSSLLQNYSEDCVLKVCSYDIPLFSICSTFGRDRRLSWRTLELRLWLQHRSLTWRLHACLPHLLLFERCKHTTPSWHNSQLWNFGSARISFGDAYQTSTRTCCVISKYYNTKCFYLSTTVITRCHRRMLEINQVISAVPIEKYRSHQSCAPLDVMRLNFSGGTLGILPDSLFEYARRSPMMRKRS